MHGGVGAHHVAPSLVVDLAGDCGINLGDRSGQRVEDPPVDGPDVQDGGGPGRPHQVARVVRLTSTGGVEGRAIQFHPVAAHGNHSGAKRP